MKYESEEFEALKRRAWSRRLPKTRELFALSWNCIEHRFTDTVGLLMVLASGLLLTGVALQYASFYMVQMLRGMFETGGPDILLMMVAVVVLALYVVGNTLLQAVFPAIYLMIWLRVVRREPVDASVLADAVPLIPAMSVMTLCTYLSTFTASLLFFVPGLIVAVGFTFAPYFLLDHKTSPLDALLMSWEVTAGHRWDIVGVTLLCSLALFVGMLCLGFGMLVAAPLVAGVFALMYDELTMPEVEA